MAAPVYTNLGANFGTAMTAGGSAHTKGSYVQITASTPSASSRIHLGHGAAGANQRYFLADLATGAAASEVVVLANLFYHLNGERLSIDCPPYEIEIANSTRVAERVQSSTGSSTFSFWVIHENRATASLGASATYGATTGSSKGTTLDPGNGGTKSSYVELSASTSAAHASWTFQIGMDTVNVGISAYVQWAMDFATGAAASEVIKVPDISFNASTLLDMPAYRHPQFIVSVASTTRIAMRALAVQSDGTSGVSTAGDRTISVCVVATDSTETVPSAHAKIGTVPLQIITGHASANTKSSYAEVEDSATGDGPRVHVGHAHASTTGRTFLIDWALGAAASEVIKVADAGLTMDDDATQGYVTPLDFDVASGSRIAVRHQSNNGGTNLRVWGIQEQRALTGDATVTYGAVTASSQMTSIDPGGVASTESAWVELTASSVDDHSFMTIVLGYPAALGLSAITSWHVDLGTGAAGAETQVLTDYVCRAGTDGDYITPIAKRFAFEIADSTRIAARCLCTSIVAADRTLSMQLIAQGVPDAAVHAAWPWAGLNPSIGAVYVT